MLHSGVQPVSDALHAEWICARSLEKSAIASNDVVHSVLRGPVKLLRHEDNGIVGPGWVRETEALGQAL